MNIVSVQKHGLTHYVDIGPGRFVVMCEIIPDYWRSARSVNAKAPVTCFDCIVQRTRECLL